MDPPDSARAIADFVSEAPARDFRNSAYDQGRRSQLYSIPGNPVSPRHEPSLEEKFQFAPEIKERIVERKSIVEQIIERETGVPEVHIVEVLKEIPHVQKVIKQVPKYEFEECIKYIPKIEVRYVEKKVEVPQIIVRDVPVEVPQVQEVTRTVPRVVVKQIPVERWSRVSRTEYEDVEELEIIPVPYIIQREVDNVIPFIPDANREVRTVENVTQSTRGKIVPVEKEVDEYVPCYIDVEVNKEGFPLHPAPSLDALLQAGPFEPGTGGTLSPPRSGPIGMVYA